ncbi:Triacylglycerol lipase SDP1 [Durusdinium trenchii]|uniref:Triacylglycerol lipase SDP1 n=1 Tax=Durusdinium trenchii TaxID=1381693 RepID=A0ABP0M3T0_9DINO
MAEEAGQMPMAPASVPSSTGPPGCAAVGCDYTIGGGLLPVALAVAGMFAVRLANAWDDECLELASLRDWLYADGIIAIIFSIPGLYALVCCGHSQGLNKCLFLPTLVLLIWGLFTYTHPVELDWASSSTTTTTTTTSTTSTTGTAIEVIEVTTCQALKIQAGIILLAQCILPFALFNYVASVVGGAGLVSGFLSFPAAIAMGSAILMWDAECQRPLATWLLFYGLILSLVPGLYFCCSGMDQEVVAYARLKQRAREERSEVPMDVRKEEQLSACAQHVNSCLCIPTVVLFLSGFYFYYHTHDLICDPTLRWWSRLVLILTALAPVLGSCCVECFDTRSSGIPGACWDPPAVEPGRAGSHVELPQFS